LNQHNNSLVDKNSIIEYMQQFLLTINPFTLQSALALHYQSINSIKHLNDTILVETSKNVNNYKMVLLFSSHRQIVETLFSCNNKSSTIPFVLNHTDMFGNRIMDYLCHPDDKFMEFYKYTCGQLYYANQSNNSITIPIVYALERHNTKNSEWYMCSKRNLDQLVRRRKTIANVIKTSIFHQGYQAQRLIEYLYSEAYKVNNGNSNSFNIIEFHRKIHGQTIVEWMALQNLNAGTPAIFTIVNTGYECEIRFLHMIATGETSDAIAEAIKRCTNAIQHQEYFNSTKTPLPRYFDQCQQLLKRVREVNSGNTMLHQILAIKQPYLDQSGTPTRNVSIISYMLKQWAINSIMDQRNNNGQTAAERITNAKHRFEDRKHLLTYWHWSNINPSKEQVLVFARNRFVNIVIQCVQ